MSNKCVNCGKEKCPNEKYRKLCWTCTNWKRNYGTLDQNDVELQKEAKHKKLKCVLCEKKSTRVVPGAYTSTGKPMHAECSWAASYFIEAMTDPVKMYLLKDRLGIEFPSQS